MGGLGAGRAGERRSGRDIGRNGSEREPHDGNRFLEEISTEGRQQRIAGFRGAQGAARRPGRRWIRITGRYGPNGSGSSYETFVNMETGKGVEKSIFFLRPVDFFVYKTLIITCK